MSRVGLVVLALSVAGSGAACIFPDVDVTGASSSGAGGATSSASATTTGKGSSSSEASTGTSSVTSSESSSGSGGIVCKEPCDSSHGAACIVNCKGPNPDACDCDKDGYHSSAPECGGMNGMVDCYDCNDKAVPTQTTYFPADRGDGSFDYDCNGMEDGDYGSTCGPSSAACTSQFAFPTVPACGMLGDKFQCHVVNLLNCDIDATNHSMQVHNCR